ncbi:MAG TPA: hypothetical protein PLI43_14695 [Albidovulum sp.]|uniref:hypothetical protein n=1 Tax=Albidovulum sp. TaxID=1872424 RepID=UPI002C221BE3|nr:hypothetical protein [Albidovulum sp.]
MVGASKILTVSYGTFSCTLEGFDEPFSTMKAIAEYFRDLASDDRYFGAVPPTPDAEMLHRIAEREIHRRVEARVSEHGVVLRPEGSSIAPPEPQPAAAKTVRPPMAEPVAETRPAIPESVAAKLARIRAVVSEAPAAAAAAPVVAEAVTFDEDEETADFGAPAATDFGFDLDIGEVPGLKLVKAAEVPVAETVAEDLTHGSFDTGAEDLAETEAEEELRALDAADDIDLDDADEAGWDAEELAAEVAESEDWSEDEAEETLAVAETADAEASEAAAVSAEDEDEAALPSARLIRISRTEAEDFDDDEEDEGADEFGDDDAAFDLSEDMPVEDRTAAVMAALSGDKYEDEKFDDEEFEDGETGEAADSDILAQIGAAIGDTGLPEAEEDDLLNEIADITRDARRDAHEGRAILESASEDDDASVERLMEEAKSKLEGTETRRRFSAIAHLKAAVAATVADRKLKTGGDAGVSAVSGAPVDDTEAYRDDLSKAVRPRRPASDSLPLTQRPTMQTRMAPLVLVSEQRVDLPEETRPEAAVVRPRRVSTAVLETKVEEEVEEEEVLPLSPEDVRSFAEFAEHLGATSLSELLEAAAAYTANVEGMTHFSRPQILRRIEGLTEDEDYSREDGLRSFGMLLRQGKIQKVRRGQFVLTDASRFKNEARRVAQ